MKKLLAVGLVMSLGSSAQAVTLTENLGGILYADIESFAADIGANFSGSPANGWHIYKSATQDLLVRLEQSVVSFGGNQYKLSTPMIQNKAGRPALPLDTLKAVFAVNVETETTGSSQVAPVAAQPAPSSVQTFGGWTERKGSGPPIVMATNANPSSPVELRASCLDDYLAVYLYSNEPLFLSKETLPSLPMTYALDAGGVFTSKWRALSSGTMAIPEVLVPSNFYQLLQASTKISFSIQGARQLDELFRVDGLKAARALLGC